MLNSSHQQVSFDFHALGFYSIVQIPGIGYCGGLLVLNQQARPLEFHCTLPVQPERSQEILYGEALESFLHCEHLGPPLLAKSRAKLDLVLIDQDASAELGQFVSHRVAHVRHDVDGDLVIHTDPPELQKAITEWSNGPDGFDLLEPFQRITSALEEAHSVTRQEA